MNFDNLSHFSVLLNESIEGLNIKPDGNYIDCTLGGGGHSGEILRRLKTGKLYCFDQDIMAIEKARKHLDTIGNNYQVINSNFEYLEKAYEEANTRFDGILYDLGVSSFQFDLPERGFSYRFDAMLDMRMDQSQALTAHYIVNNYSVEELTRILKDYGEEKFAFFISKKIVQVRQTKPINTTLELVEVIKSALPAKVLRSSSHPAKQTFQALRIAVNDELQVLKTSLEKALDLLNVGGRIVVITFHSLEDRIVKNIFKKATTLDLPKGLPFIPEGYEVKYQLINKHVILPTEEELSINNRSHSAKLRIIERIKD